MTPCDLVAIRERLDKASAGPWTRVFNVGRQAWVLGTVKHFAAAPNHDIHDLEFAAHAREDVPALVTEVEALRVKLEQVKGIMRSETNDRMAINLAISELEKP